MTAKIVVSKAFNGSPIMVNLTNKELAISASLNDFIDALARSTAKKLAEIAAEGAGNPALLLTNAQLKAKLSETISADAVAAELILAAGDLVELLKSHSVVAE